MHKTNYTLFGILRYKIEFLECIEYTILSNTYKKENIQQRINYLENDFTKGIYKEIISTLFTSYNELNKPIIDFLNTYNPKTILKILQKNKLKNYLTFNEKLIDCYELFSYIISEFTQEEQISKSLDSNIKNLIFTNSDYFINVLFFNSYNLYLNCFFNKNKKISHSKKDIERLIKIMNYCNKENLFNHSITILEENNENDLYKELESLSNKCIKLEKEQDLYLNKIIKIIEDETKMSKN